MSKSRDLADIGSGQAPNLEDVNASNSFTSPGIDDNATTNQVTISDADTQFNNRVYSQGTELSADSPVRNGVVNQEALTQAESARAGMSSTIYTGDGIGQSINNGLDMATGDFGGLVWVKNRTAATTDSHQLTDTVRGANRSLISDQTAIEQIETQMMTSFNTTGFSVGSDVNVNTNSETYVAWSFQTTKKKEPTYAANLLTGDDTDFTTTIGTWVLGDAASGLTIVANALRITNNDASAGHATQTLTTVIGETYEISINSVGGTAGIGYVHAGTAKSDATSAVATDDVFKPIAPGIQTCSFVASSTSTIVTLVSGSVTNGLYYDFDDVIIRNVTNDALTNRGKPYTAHYNPDMNFSIVGYEGDGVDGHEIPHHLGVVPELSIWKSRDSALHWFVTSPLFGQTGYTYLSLTDALATTAAAKNIPATNNISIGSSVAFNTAADNYISYNFASKSGVCKIGKYIGTGAAGNYVSTEVDGGDAFKPSFVMVKNLTGVGDWEIQDSIRGDFTLNPHSSAAESASGTDNLDFVDSGFYAASSGGDVNTINSEYIFMAFAETSIDATKATTDYSYPTNASNIDVANNTLISVANGFNASGEVNSKHTFTGTNNLTLGAGYEDKKLYIYSDKTGTLGSTEIRPLTGYKSRNDADKYGQVSPSDKTLRITSNHFDYESDSGVALASDELSTTYQSWRAFGNRDNDIIATANWSWTVTSITNSWLQYKHNEKRILKSWRFREDATIGREPQRFTIEGSNDGLNWTAIDSTYTASDYVGNGASLWGNLQDTSANTTAYLYHRINITANGTDPTYTAIATLEFNTIIASDYYLVEDGKTYNDSDTPIERVYLGEVITDSNGDVSDYTSYSPISKVSNMEIHEDLTVHGEIENRGVCTAWVSFDGSVNPPLINDSYNIIDIVDYSSGNFRAVFETPMEHEKYIVSGNAGAGTMLGTNNTVLSKHHVDFACYNHAGAVENPTNTTLAVFGGKKIK